MEPTVRVVLDSSVILAHYNKIDEFHAEAVKSAVRIQESTIIVHPYVIQEVTTLLTYRQGVSGAQQFLDDIRGSENIFVPAVDTKKDMAYFMEVNRKISFTDTTLVRLAKEMNASLLTFDKQMLALFRQGK